MDYTHQTPEQGREVSKRAWARAVRVIEKLGPKPPTATPTTPTKLAVTQPDPVKRSVARAEEAHANPNPEVLAETKKARRQRVQITLWAIGKCGNTELARNAFDRAIRAMEDE